MASKQNQYKYNKKNSQLIDCFTNDKLTAKKLIDVRRGLEQRADVNTTDDDGNTPLHLAVCRERAIIVKLLLKRGANVNAENKYGNTPLHVAVFSRRMSIAELLLNKDADVNAVTIYRDTPLHWAVHSGDMHVVELLLNKGVDLNAQARNRSTPLHVAAKCGYTSIAELLLSKGANLYAKDQYGSTTLHEAASSGEISIVELVLNKGIDVCVQDTFKFTPLHKGAGSGEMSVVKFLLDKGADVNAQAINGNTPLHEAARSGEISVVELLLDKGAEVNPHTPNGNTPLHMAFHSKEMTVVKLLLNKGADVDVQTMDGDTPLHKASSCGDISVVEQLLDKGAKVNVPATNGETPLHRAARFGDVSVVELLLNKGATINARGIKEKTPLHVAASSRKMSVMKLLINKGADVNAQSTNGDTPLHLVLNELALSSTMKQQLYKMKLMNVQATPLLKAEYSEEISIVKLLLNKDAKVNVQIVVPGNMKGYMPLHLAAHFGLTSFVELLLNKDADVNAQTAKGYTPLHLVAQSGQTSIVELLRNKGADVNLPDNVGNTPLHEAVRSQQPATIKQLLSIGVDVNVRNEEGKTPLYLAAELESTLILGQLIKVADVTVLNTNGDTPLHGAVRFGRLSNVKLLLYKNADINAQNINGETPLHVAVRHEYLALATLLIRRDANVTLRNNAGETPRNYAILFSVDEKIKSLLQAAEKEASKNAQLDNYRSQISHDIFLNDNQDVFSNISLLTGEIKYSKTTDTSASGLLGQLYETKLVSLIFIRVLNHEQIGKEVLLGVNIDDIGAMDDICLRYRVEGHFEKPVVLFMQAKHKEAQKKLTNESLWSDSGDFSLRKYFESYLMIRERFRVGHEDPMFEGEYSDVDCYFVLYTTAKENITKKRTQNKVNKTVDALINTGQNTEPFQYSYNQADIEHLAEIATTVRINLSDAISFPNESLIEYYKKQAKDFLSSLWFYCSQAKHDAAERIVKDEINQHYNNKKDSDKFKFDLHSNAIFLKVHHEIQEWWKLKGKAPYLTRSDDFFTSAKKDCLDNVLVTFCNAMDHLKMSVDWEFNQRFNQSDFPFRTPIVFNTIVDRLCKIFDANTKIITLDIDIKNEFVNLLITDKKYDVLNNNNRLQNVSHFFKSFEQDAITNNDYQNNEQSEYSKRSGTSEVGGILFRTKMLNLVHLRALNHEQIEQDSLLGNKFLGISVMSDICLRYKVKDQQRPVALFVQLIHREHPEKGALTDDSLWSDSEDFSLLKYFNSYLMIRERFRVGHEDPMFEGEFSDVDCYFVLYTTANENITKKKTEYKLSSVVQDLIHTEQNTNTFQYDYDETDIDSLTKTSAMDRIEKLGTVFLESIMREKYNPNVLSNKLIARYHVAMGRQVLQQCEMQPANKEYRLWEFRSEFFNSDDEYLITLMRTFVKIISTKRCDQKKICDEWQQNVKSDDIPKKLESLKIKLPLAFGNIDVTFRGNEAKVQKRIKVLVDKLMYLLDLNKDTKIVEINDDDVGPGKTIEQGIIDINGGIGGAVGNLLVNDTDSNALKFYLDNKALPHNAVLFLDELKDDRHRHRHVIADLSSYRFKINIKDFPKYSFNPDEYDKTQARDFLNKFWFYPNQAKEDEVERILKDEINKKYSDNNVYHNHNKNRNISDLISLHSLDETLKWWMQTSESPYLRRESELFERAELADIYNRLESVINFMYISNIYNIGIKVKRVDKHKASEQIHELFKKIVVKLFQLCNLRFDEQFELRAYDYEISEESTLSLKIDPEMEWVALTVTSMKTGKFANTDVKRCFVAKAATGHRRRKDAFTLYEQYLCGRLYRFKDCVRNYNIEFFKRS